MLSFSCEIQLLTVIDIWFHRLNAEGIDIQGRFDYNSWQESDTGRKLASSLSKDIVLAEGMSQPCLGTEQGY